MSAIAAGSADDRPLSIDEAAALFAPLSDQDCLLVAVSGGPDSVALLALLAEWAMAEAGRPTLRAATIDHGLRPEAAQEARDVGRLCEALAIPHAVLVWEGEKPVGALQEKAREARYRLLRTQAKALGGASIVTAHTLDDQAETLLMRIAKGSGPAGLAGMRARVSRDGAALARPLLGIAKARLVATCRARGLDFVTDPSNADPRFDRVRWRGLTPLLAQQGVTAARLGRLAERLARAEEALDARAQELTQALFRPGPPRQLDFAGLGAEPDEMVIRVLARALAASSETREGEPRLERLEACALALLAALRAGTSMRRTLAGLSLSLSRDGQLTLAPEAERKRGVHPAIE